jgi:hypothetical protein
MAGQFCVFAGEGYAVADARHIPQAPLVFTKQLVIGTPNYLLDVAARILMVLVIVGQCGRNLQICEQRVRHFVADQLNDNLLVALPAGPHRN